uniref:Uncharacterized protein n=1 Tax=Anguilla anguilla TaxID=7936 RepID=A0A0E9UPP9_ANGAN
MLMSQSLLATAKALEVQNTGLES